MKLNDIKAGQTIVTDDRFTCVAPGPKQVECDILLGLWVPCDHGRHFLDGQEDEMTGELVGIHDYVAP